MDWEVDPKRLAFTFARYKFVAKMLFGLGEVLEVGAESGYMSRIVEQHGCKVTTIDKANGFDYTKMNVGRRFKAVYALDVLEHIDPEDENAFMLNICSSLVEHGVCIIGSPSLESQPYATENLRAGGSEHVNCKTEEGLRKTMKTYFQNVFIFGMNDETLHTGFGPMCHYRLAVCTTPRSV